GVAAERPQRLERARRALGILCVRAVLGEVPEDGGLGRELLDRRLELSATGSRLLPEQLQARAEKDLRGRRPLGRRLVPGGDELVELAVHPAPRRDERPALVHRRLVDARPPEFPLDGPGEALVLP